ncbi:MAG: DUF928 domain-containing protein [Hydrococcus sp. CRU_1_1]|nr:DUF928 domain-containing protein [Hydrococcus sp. CRU_1_1]
MQIQPLAVASQPSYLSYTSPPENNSNSSEQRTTTSTSRGCNEKEPPITVVIPAQQIAATALEHPTFCCTFLAFSLDPLKFRLRNQMLPNLFLRPI